jgi:hypothetical protein
VTAPVFPVTVTTSVTPSTTSASATLQFRPQDVGTSGSVYVFAVAPATIVQGAATQKDVRIAWTAKDAEKDSVACVLAQLNAAGQLQAVSVSSIQAYVTSVLSGQGQAVTVLNGVPTVNIAGATFYVGYGPSATTMINSGVNRSVVAVPGSASCAPQPPQTRLVVEYRRGRARVFDRNERQHPLPRVLSVRRQRPRHLDDRRRHHFSRRIALRRTPGKLRRGADPRRRTTSPGGRSPSWAT